MSEQLIVRGAREHNLKNVSLESSSARGGLMYDERVPLQDEQTPPRIVGPFKVSARGQLSLPADVRRRWGIEKGGRVEIADLGESLLIVPGGEGAMRRHVFGGIDHEAYQDFVDSIDDPDLRTE